MKLFVSKGVILWLTLAFFVSLYRDVCHVFRDGVSECKPKLFHLPGVLPVSCNHPLRSHLL